MSEQATAELVLSEKRQKAADRIAPLFKFTGDQATIENKEWHQEEGAPTTEQITAVQDHALECTLNLQAAAGIAGVDYLAANPDLDSVEFEVPYGNDTVRALVRRNYTHQSKPGSKDSVPVNTHGHITIGYETRSPAEMKHIRNYIKQLGNAKIDV